MSNKGLRGKIPISVVPIVAMLLKGVFLTDSAYNPFNIDADHDPGRLRIHFIMMRIWILDPHRIKWIRIQILNISSRFTWNGYTILVNRSKKRENSSKSEFRGISEKFEEIAEMHKKMSNLISFRLFFIRFRVKAFPCYHFKTCENCKIRKNTETL